MNINEFASLLNMELDEWQKNVLNTEGSIALRSGRQVGKSTVIALKAAHYMITHPNKTVLVIASVERQAQLLFEKILATVYQIDKKYIKKGKDKPTKHKLVLMNKSVLHCLPTGLSGYGIRGYTVDLLIADEAAFIPEDVWVAVNPMLATTRGDLILLSTPFGKGGFFFDCFRDPKFSKFHVSSEDCPRIPKEYLAHQRMRMSRLQYAQEFLGDFLDELRQLFSRDLIRSCKYFEPFTHNPLNMYMLGVDCARYGGDENSFVIAEIDHRDQIRIVKIETTSNVSTVNTIINIEHLDQIWNFNKIMIDDGGLGGSILDVLLENDKIKRKIIGINNASRVIDRGGRKKKLLKEELYMHLLSLMEHGKIKLPDHKNMTESLCSVQYEYTEDGNLRIFGKYTHITEGMIRAAWGLKTKGLRPFIA